MLPELEAQLEQILNSIVSSEAPRKVIVAGPGTGKTTLFRRLLQARDGPRDGRLVLTFITTEGKSFTYGCLWRPVTVAHPSPEKGSPSGAWTRRPEESLAASCNIDLLTATFRSFSFPLDPRSSESGPFCLPHWRTARKSVRASPRDPPSRRGATNPSPPSAAGVPLLS